MRVPAGRRAAKPSSVRRTPLARQEFGKCVLGPGIAHHLCGVTMLCRPTRVEALCLLLEQQRLDPPDGTAMVIRYHFRDLHRLGAQLAFGDQVIEKTNAIGLLGLYDARSEQQLLGLRPADLAAKGPSRVYPPVGRREEAEAGTLATDPYVERGGEYGGAAIGEAVHHADYWLRANGDFQRAPGIAHAILFFATVTLVVLNLLLDVATRRQRVVAGAGDDEAADPGVGLEQHHRIEQLVSELAVHVVKGLRPVECDDADTVLPLDEDVLVGHNWTLLFSFASCGRGGAVHGVREPLPIGKKPYRPSKSCSWLQRFHRLPIHLQAELSRVCPPTG